MKRIIFITILLLLFSINLTMASQITTFEFVPYINDNEVAVTVKFSNNSLMCGGAFEFVYNDSKLELVEVQEANALKNTTHFINEFYKENTVKINWVSLSPMDQADILCTIKFKMLESEFKKSDIAVENMKLADENGNKISVDSLVVYQDSDESLEPEDSTTPIDPVQPLEPENSVTETDSFKPLVPDEKLQDTTVGYIPTKRPTVSSNESVSKNNNQDTSSGNAYKENESVAEETSKRNVLPFQDVKEFEWYYESVKFAYNNNLVKGLSETEFSPESSVTRAMFVTFLYRMEAEPQQEHGYFSDIDEDAWYSKAVAWASINNVVNGVSKTEFAPNTNITREQIATIMFRYAQYKGMDAVTLEENLHFSDANEISEYAVSAMNWAVGTGLINGKSATTLNPLDNATRAEIAAILQRFIENNK